jgi:hypothetical protein
MSSVGELWRFLLWGYVLTVALETPVLLAGLSRRHTIRRKLLAGVWLTACTYPIVVLVLPILVEEPFGRIAYLAVAETFAPLAECALFYAAFCRDDVNPPGPLRRDFAAIVLANLLSFVPIELLRLAGVGWLGRFGL